MVQNATVTNDGSLDDHVSGLIDLGDYHGRTVLAELVIGLLFWLAGLACRHVLAGTIPGTTFWTKLR
jgi:hypothetical protein